MASDNGSSDEMRDLLRQVVASNLTIAYQMEQLRRQLHPKDEKLHPLAQVLETFDMIREVMGPEEDEDSDDLEDSADIEVGEARSPSALLEGTPFESTLRYLRPRRKKPEGG
jgi:hypothetical protein